jgi:ankyrin repeat protein
MVPSYALMDAIRQDCTIETYEYLLKMTDNIDYQTNKGRTALMVAVKVDRIDILKLLINAGANLNLQDYCGRTALMFATDNADEQYVQILLNAGADPCLQDTTGSTALILAVWNQFSVNTIQMLLNAGANVNATEYLYGKMPLMHIDEYCNQENFDETVASLIKMFIMAGVNINHQNNYGDTLTMIVWTENPFKLLIDAGANLYLRNDYGETALICFVEHKKVNMIKMAVKSFACDSDFLEINPII